MNKQTIKQRAANLTKAFVMSGYDDVTGVGITRRDGYDEVRVDSIKLHAAALVNTAVVLNTIRFAEPTAQGVYAKAIIGGIKAPKKANAVRRIGIIAHIPQ